eukprot:SM000055S18300  [mRNA]  locus=s55:729092:731923:+ [translate_table: standard]
MATLVGRTLAAAAAPAVVARPSGGHCAGLVKAAGGTQQSIAATRSFIAATRRTSYFRKSRARTWTRCSIAAADNWRVGSGQMLVTLEGQVETPCGQADVEFVDPREPIKVVPILRAGLVLVEHMASVLPAMQTYHLGYARDEETLQPSMYLNKLPTTFPEGSRVLIADPMLATGGTIVAAIEEVVRRGADVKLMRVVSAVAAPSALKQLSEKFPGLHVYTGVIDPELNDKGYIVPGLGDAGDRSFGTD